MEIKGNKSVQTYIIEQYYRFMGKLYGEEVATRNFEFEERVYEKFGMNPEKDIDVEVTFGYKTKSGEKCVRKARPIGRFADFQSKAIPGDTIQIVLDGEFVERNANQEKVRAEKKKDRFAFREQIKIVKYVKNKNISFEPGKTKTLTKEYLESCSEIIKFEKHELTL